MLSAGKRVKPKPSVAGWRRRGARDDQPGVGDAVPHAAAGVPGWEAAARAADREAEGGRSPLRLLRAGSVRGRTAQVARVQALGKTQKRIIPYLFPRLAGRQAGARIVDYRKAWATACRAARATISGDGRAQHGERGGARARRHEGDGPPHTRRVRLLPTS